MLRSVAVIAMDQVAAFELGVLAEVFGTDRTADGGAGAYGRLGAWLTAPGTTPTSTT